MTPLGVASTTGIGGLTLGGGYGWTVGEFGLACDNVTRLEVVTAEGIVVECSAEQNQELFWGMRGAGQNFGIATQIEYRLHPLTEVYGGPLFYPLSAEIMRLYEEFVSNAPDRLTALGAATKMPDGTLAFGVIVCYHGSPAEGEAAIKILRDFGKPMADMIAVRPYLEMQSLFDKDIPPGKRYYNKSHNLRRIDAGTIDAVLQFTATILPYPSMIGFQRLHGAAAGGEGGRLRSYWLHDPEWNLERGLMNTYQAILRAADHIQQQPQLFDFERTRIPRDCHTPGCALGWIGFFAGRTQARIPSMLGLSFLHRGIAIVTPDAGSEPVIPVSAREFYERMDRLATCDWRHDAGQCANALRLYAATYHQTGAFDPAYVAFREALGEQTRNTAVPDLSH